METRPLNVASLSKKEFDKRREKPDNYLFFVYDEYKGEDGRLKTRIRLYKGDVLVSGDVNMQENNTSLAFYPRIIAAGTVEPVLLSQDSIYVKDFKIDMKYGMIHVDKVYVDPGFNEGESRFIKVYAHIDNGDAFKDIVIIDNPVIKPDYEYIIGNALINKIANNKFVFYINDSCSINFVALGINF